jgi:hypothetical protein
MWKQLGKMEHQHRACLVPHAALPARFHVTPRSGLFELPVAGGADIGLRARVLSFNLTTPTKRHVFCTSHRSLNAHPWAYGSLRKSWTGRARAALKWSAQTDARVSWLPRGTSPYGRRLRLFCPSSREARWLWWSVSSTNWLPKEDAVGHAIFISGAFRTRCHLNQNQNSDNLHEPESPCLRTSQQNLSRALE